MASPEAVRTTVEVCDERAVVPTKIPFPDPVRATRPAWAAATRSLVRTSPGPDLGAIQEAASMRSLLPMRGFRFGTAAMRLLRHRHPPLVMLDVRPRLPRPGEPLIERSSDLVCGVLYLGQVVGV